MYKIGVMGAKRGYTFVKALQYMKNAECVALCENDESALEDVKPFLTDNIKIYKDYNEFVQSGLDAVILCNYFHKHAECAIKAFESGVAVLSETTAAATLGDCVKLVEKCEEHKGIYMLAANCLYFDAVHTMKKRIDDNKTGKVIYGEAEYLHGPLGDGAKKPLNFEEIDYDNLHWRQIMPSNMYNMHTLGPLMYVTDSVPRTVSCKMIRNNGYRSLALKDTVGAVVVTEMSNGAVFQTTGCNSYGPTSKWYRLACENETIETERYGAGCKKLIVSTGDRHQENIWLTAKESGIIGEDDNIDQNHVNASGHGGIDYYLVYHFLKVLEKKEQPFFDVYRSAALSAVGILGWYSALTDSREFKIPDFSKKEDRDLVRNDFRSPFAKSDSEWWIPCRIDEKHKFVLNPEK